MLRNKKRSHSRKGKGDMRVRQPFIVFLQSFDIDHGEVPESGEHKFNTFDRVDGACEEVKTAHLNSL
jgi:hypothetical protein